MSEKPKILWAKELSGAGLAGIAATGEYVIVADRAAVDLHDVFRCLRADTGAPVWSLEYPAPGDLDYGNSVRATPLVCGGNVYLLGAFGHVHCVDLISGKVIWKKNVTLEFGAKLPRWGMCSSLLAVGDRLIVNPGATGASLVALDRHTGDVVWRSSGAPAAYASFIAGRFGGVEQIVGYDAVSLGGWDAKTGKRLWQLVPPEDGDYNVPTPIEVEGKLLVSTENNGTRLHDFGRNGTIVAKPAAVNEDLAPDSSTPVVLGDKVLGCPGRGELFCLDLHDLKTLWTLEDEGFDDYVSLIGSGDRLLVTTARGELLLVSAKRSGGEILSRVRLLGEDADVYSHPAIVNERLYIRDASSVYCFGLEDSPVVSRDPAGASP